MNEQHLEFLGEMMKRIAEAHNVFRNNDCKISIEHHDLKDYWTIDCEYEYGNSKYSDCVVFYLNKDDFEPQSVLDDFDKIYQKAKTLFGKD